MSDPQLLEELNTAKKQIQVLHQRLSVLEQAGSAGTPRTMLLDQSFLKRAFAVLGHYLVASLIIGVPFYILFFILFFALGIYDI